MLIEKIKFSEQNNLDVKELVSLIIQVIEKTNYKKQFYDWDMVLFLDESHAFLLQYHEETNDNEEQKQGFYETLEIISESLIEAYLKVVQLSILYNDYVITIIWCRKAINYLLDNQFLNHYFWDSIIFSLLLSRYSENGCHKLQQVLQEIYNDALPIIQRPLQNIVEFFELIVELEQMSDFNENNQALLQKIEKIEFEKYFMKYQKQLALEKIYQKYNLKKKLDQCYQNQIELLSQHKQLYCQFIERIEEKKKNNAV